MQKIIFTEEYCRPANLHPFTLTRHIQDIRIGILTIREKWERLLKLPSFDKWEGYYLDDEHSIKIDKNIGKDICLMVHANVLPTKNIVNKIKEGCKDLVQLCQLSGAGMGCGSCRPEVKTILEKETSVHAEKIIRA